MILWSRKDIFFYQECPISVIILAALRKVPGSRASCKALRWHKGSLRGRREGKEGFGHVVIRFAETTSTHILPYSPFIWPNIHIPKGHPDPDISGRGGLEKMFFGLSGLSLVSK